MDEDLPSWVTKEREAAMRCWLENQMSKLLGGKQRPQPLHIDVGLPTTLEALEEYLKGTIAITAGRESVFVYIVPRSQELMLELAKAHIR